MSAVLLEATRHFNDVCVWFDAPESFQLVPGKASADDLDYAYDCLVDWVGKERDLDEDSARREVGEAILETAGAFEVAVRFELTLMEGSIYGIVGYVDVGDSQVMIVNTRITAGDIYKMVRGKLMESMQDTNNRVLM